MINIIRHEPQFEEQVADMVLNIQQNEFSVPLTRADQPDMFTIEDFYRSTGGEFWIALKNESEVVGSIAIIRIGDGNGVIRKMFVAKDHRGKDLGIAQRLFDQLVQFSMAQGIHTLFLGTIDRLHAAIRFYERNGFQLVEKESLPVDFPIMAVDNKFFKCDLIKEETQD